MNRAGFKRTAPAPLLNFIPEPYDVLSQTHGASHNGTAASRGGLHQTLDGSSKFVPFHPIEPRAFKPDMAELDYR